jgi:uncharacterized membrane protein SirB2
MTLGETYLLLKPLHITLVALSGLLFAARGAAVLVGQGWPMRPAWRHASVAIDTLLLAAGVTMWAVLSLHPLRNGWLGAKLALLGVYIVLGSFALKRARSPRERALCYAAALAVFLCMVSIARAHHPLGALTWLFAP